MNILLNAKLGDGCVYRNEGNKNAHIHFMSKDYDYLMFKMKECLKAGLICGEVGMGTSGYTGKKNIYRFSTRVDPRITEVYGMSVVEAIEQLEKEDIITWYLDDGSFHKVRKTMHLYCNALKDFEVDALIKKITDLYNVSPRIRTDRKKDGREYPYLYFPRVLVEIFRLEVLDFIEKNSIPSMTYKAGESGRLWASNLFNPDEPSTTTEQDLQVVNQLSRVGRKSARKARERKLKI